MTDAIRHAWIALAALFAVLAFAVLLAGSPGQPAAASGPGDRGLARALEVNERHTERLLARPGIVGTGVGADVTGTAVIRVYTKHAGVSVRTRLNGVGVAPAVTGPIAALHHRPGHSGGPGGGGDGGDGGGEDPPPEPSEPSRTDAWPGEVPIGVSTGRADECAAGTIGARLSDGEGSSYALSNNHVYAKENDGEPGDLILQPGRYDLGCAQAAEQHQLGTLAASVEIVFTRQADNVVDAAVAATDRLGVSTPTDGYGSPSGNSVAAKVGQAVQKYGRTTGLTSGQVDAIGATVNIGYGSGTARFVDQIVVRSRPGFIRAGDSGSLLVTDPARDAVGLLFAGDSPGRYGIANPIGDVLSLLGSELEGATLSIDSGS